MRMGIGVTGVLQATPEQRGWLSNAYKELREFDVEYSAKNKWPVSIKITTCKPSGTLSLLPGVTPGIHPAFSKFMIRRIRIASEHPLVNVCKEHGYHVEFNQNIDGSDDYSTVVVSFPFRYPDTAITASEMTALQQLEEIRKLQQDWSDNSVSCTVYYRKEELPAIQEYLLNNYKTSHKSLSFLLHSGHGFNQAPMEEISEEAFNLLVANTRSITGVSGNIDFDAADDCAGGMCPVK